MAMSRFRRFVSELKSIFIRENHEKKHLTTAFCSRIVLETIKMCDFENRVSNVTSYTESKHNNCVYEASYKNRSLHVGMIILLIPK